MIINEKEFINRMAEKGGVTKCSSKKYLYLVIETFLDLLKEGHVIRFYRLFKAELTTVVGKTSTDFANGGRIYVEPQKKIKMTWSKKLRNRINVFIDEESNKQFEISYEEGELFKSKRKADNKTAEERKEIAMKAVETRKRNKVED